LANTIAGADTANAALIVVETRTATPPAPAVTPDDVRAMETALRDDFVAADGKWTDWRAQ
jgi:hypothetical protein